MYKYLESLNNEQLEAVLSNDNEIMLVAGAGKTNTIVKKIIYLIKEQRVILSNILAVTFINKAVREIRERVNNSLFTNHSGVVDTFHQLAKTKNSLNDIANSNEISTSYDQKQVSIYQENIKVRKDTLPKVLGIDEINGVRTYQGKYNCLIYDIENKKVKDFLVTRRKQYLDDYF